MLFSATQTRSMSSLALGCRPVMMPRCSMALLPGQSNLETMLWQLARCASLRPARGVMTASTKWALRCCQVRDLTRPRLRDPEYLTVHAEAGASTPAKLQQAVMEVSLHQELDALWSFIKTHLRVGDLSFGASLQPDVRVETHSKPRPIRWAKPCRFCCERSARSSCS